MSEELIPLMVPAIPEGQEAPLGLVQRTGSVAISAAELQRYSGLGNPWVQKIEDLVGQKGQLDYWTQKLRDGGFPIDNESLVINGMEVSILNALDRCGAQWFLATYGYGPVHIFSWGVGQLTGIHTIDLRRGDSTPMVQVVEQPRLSDRPSRSMRSPRLW